MNEEIEIEEYAPWLVIFITLTGGFLRALLLDAKGLWLDETFSVWVASHSVGDMLQWIVKIDQHPPLYYLLLHYWITLTGDTPYDVRLLSALFGTGTIPIIYLIGKRMSGVVMGLAAAVFLALSPFHIYFAQETRMYTLLTFTAAVAIYALVRLLTDARSVRPIGSQFREYLHAWRSAEPVIRETKEDFSYKDETPSHTVWKVWVSRHHWLPIQDIETDLAWISLIVFSAATMLSHNTAILFPFATNLFVFGLMFLQSKRMPGSQLAFQSPPIGNWLKAQIGVLLLWSPWMLPFIKQVKGVLQRFWIPEPTLESVIQVLKSFLNASAPIPANQAMLVWSFYGLVLCLGLLHYRKKITQFVFLVVLFATPFLIELIVSLHRPIFLDRTLIWITIPLFLVLAAGIAQLRFKFLMLGVLGILGAINIFSAGDYYRFYQKEDWYSAAGYVALYAEEGDLILFNSNFVEIPFNYYFKSYEELYHIQVEKRGIPLDLINSGILEPLMTTGDVPELISLLSGHDRVWLVYSHNSYTDPTRLIPQTLASVMIMIQHKDFHGGQIQLYEAP